MAMRAIWTVSCLGALVEICACQGGSSGTGGETTASSTLTTGGSSGGEATGTSGTTGSQRASGSGTSGGTSGGSSTGRCDSVPSGPGGSCVTTADCPTGSVCTSDHGGGICIAEGIPAPDACLPGASACGQTGDPPCCGFCRNSSCVDISAAPCSSKAGTPCRENIDCCVNLACVSDAGQQTCQPSCGQENDVCNPAHGNADCCVGLGLACQGYAGGDAGPFECNNQYAVVAGGGCASMCSEKGPPECQLGSPCDPSVQPDNCVPAGLYCDLSNDVCEGPLEFDLCLPGGPACGLDSSLANSRLEPVCAATMYTTAPICAELCDTTADCLHPDDACCTACSPPVCLPGWLIQPCTDFFGACDAQGTNDGICAPYNFQGMQLGVCIQATASGGGLGSACAVNGNRENPGFCDTSHICTTGFCGPACNSGTAKDLPCPDPANQICVPVYGETTDSDDFGSCYTKCDFLSDAGCSAPDGGVPQVCVPGLVYGLGDANLGVCAAQAPDPAPIGAPCTAVDGIIITPSPCVQGGVCYNNPVPGGGSFCDQPCLVGDKCPNGSDCQPISFAGQFTSVVGVCF